MKTLSIEEMFSNKLIEHPEIYEVLSPMLNHLNPPIQYFVNLKKLDLERASGDIILPPNIVDLNIRECDNLNPSFL